jgi:hypothetical protein
LEKEAVLSRGSRFLVGLLFVLVLLSLALNGYLIWQWLAFRSQALALAHQANELRQSALDVVAQFRQELQGIDEMILEYDVHIDERLPVDAVVPFRERLEVPIETVVPISQTIQTTFDLEIPQFGLSIPVDVAVPVQLEVPINLSVPVEIDRDIPVQTTVPISLEVPIVIDLADVGLVRYIELIDLGLADLEQALKGIGE